LQRFSLSDFPGRMAAVVFTQGCNYKCSYCHNPGLIAARGDDSMDADEIFRFLSNRRGKLDGVVISGGEPTLQPGLIDFIQRVRRLGFAVKLDTNGSSPDLLGKIVDDRLADYIAMDIKAPLHRYAEVTGVACDITAVHESIRLLLASEHISHEFRTTVAQGQLTEADLLSCARMLFGAQRYVIQSAVEKLPAADDNLIYSLGLNFVFITRRIQQIGLNCIIRD